MVAEDGIAASEQDEESRSEDRGETPDDLDAPDDQGDQAPRCKRRRVSVASSENQTSKLLIDSITTNHSRSEEDMEVKEEIDLDEESHLYVDESVDSSDGDFLSPTK